MGRIRDALKMLNPVEWVVRAADEQRLLEQQQARGAERAAAHMAAMRASIRARVPIELVNERNARPAPPGVDRESGAADAMTEWRVHTQELLDNLVVRDVAGDPVLGYSQFEEPAQWFRRLPPGLLPVMSRAPARPRAARAAARP